MLMSNAVVVIVEAVETPDSVSMVCRAVERTFSLRSARERRAPWECSWRATASPIPPRPVTAYTLPLTESIFFWCGFVGYGFGLWNWGGCYQLGVLYITNLCYTWDVTVTLNNGGDITWGRRFSVANLGTCSGIFELHLMKNRLNGGIRYLYSYTLGEWVAMQR